MANFFKPTKPTAERYFDLEITGLDGKCNGIGKVGNRTWFVPGTMPGDKIKAETTEISKNTGFAKVQKFYEKSSKRIDHNCKYEHCGGCSCLFIPTEDQIQAKKRGIQQIFRKNAGFDLPEPSKITEGSRFQYRRTCRLSTYYNRNTKQIEIGFRQAASHKIAEIETCPVLKKSLSDLITKLRKTLNQISSKEFFGHIELTEAENGVFITIQHNREFSSEDISILRSKLCTNQVFVYLLNKNHVLKNINENSQQPFYTINGLKLLFSPESFIQINEAVNESIVSTVIDYANPKENDDILDLFCGMGNLTLPLAQKAHHVTGVEVVSTMVDQGRTNAAINNVSKASFIQQDLAVDFSKEDFAKHKYSCIILDPGREGAGNAIKFICKQKIKHLVYVSCNPITVTRDMAILNKAGYKIIDWSIFNMFSNTEHIEAVFNIELK